MSDLKKLKGGKVAAFYEDTDRQESDAGWKFYVNSKSDGAPGPKPTPQ